MSRIDVEAMGFVLEGYLCPGSVLSLDKPADSCDPWTRPPITDEPRCDHCYPVWREKEPGE